MNKTLIIQSIIRSTVFTFARSGGPGGQNVNKVNTKVFVTLPLAAIEGLSETEKQLLTEKLSGRLDSIGNIYLSVDEERSQMRNREIALARLESLIIQAAKREKNRIPTKPGKAAKIRRLTSKKQHSEIKSGRNKHSLND